MGTALEKPRCPSAGALPARHLHRRSGIPSDQWQSCPHSRKRCQPFSAKTPRTCRPASSRASPPVGRRNTTAGRAVISRRAATSFARSLEPVAFAGSPVADGVYLQARMEPEAECVLVIIGATPEGSAADQKTLWGSVFPPNELLGCHVGIRESAQSWRELLIDIKARGLAMAPEVAVGDGALGFWKAVDEVFPGTRHQRCWFHNRGHDCHWSEGMPEVECSQQAPQVHGPGGHLRPARYPSCPNESGGLGGHQGLHGKIRGQIRPRRRLPDQGHRGDADVHRLPG